MAALLIMISLLSIGMIALLPVWRQQSQREKEAELAFRGEQYARAIYLFRTKNGNQPPPNIDVLVQGRFLRKKYKDPITGEDFQPIFGGQQPQPGAPGRGGAQSPGGAQLPGGAAPGRGAQSGTWRRDARTKRRRANSHRFASGARRRSDADRRRLRFERRGPGHRRLAGRHRPGDGRRARAKRRRSASTTTRRITTSGSSSITRVDVAVWLETVGSPASRASARVVLAVAGGQAAPGLPAAAARVRQTEGAGLDPAEAAG